MREATRSSSAAFAEWRRERRLASVLFVPSHSIVLFSLIYFHSLPPPAPQLCFDHQFDSAAGRQKIACLCAAPECRKWIN